MRMRQSISQLERAFVDEVNLERSRREHLRHTASKRSRERRLQKNETKGSFRFFLLALTIIATALVVTAVMFQTLYIVMG